MKYTLLPGDLILAYYINFYHFCNISPKQSSTYHCIAKQKTNIFKLVPHHRRAISLQIVNGLSFETVTASNLDVFKRMVDNDLQILWCKQLKMNNISKFQSYDEHNICSGMDILKAVCLSVYNSIQKITTLKDTCTRVVSTHVHDNNGIYMTVSIDHVNAITLYLKMPRELWRHICIPQDSSKTKLIFNSGVSQVFLSELYDDALWKKKLKN